MAASATVLRDEGRRRTSSRPGRILHALATEWHEVGGIGRLAVVGLVVSGVVAIVLGASIERSVRHHLLQVRTEVMQEIVDDLAARRLLPLGRGTSRSTSAIDAAIEHRLIASEVLGVAIRDTAGKVVYGSLPRSSSGATLHEVWAAHVEQHPDGLLHFRLPVRAPDGTLVGSFEVFERAESSQAVVARVRRNVSLSIVTGLGTLGVAMGAFTLAHARALDRRRRHAEQLLEQLLRTEDTERRRIIGSLHDDVGQPLYRVLYGLAGCRTRLAGMAEIESELTHLEALVRQVDRTLRDELRHLHRSTVDSLDMTTALEAIAEECRAESGLDVDLGPVTPPDPPPVVRSVLLRAVQEAVTNVRKHARATHVVIRTTRGRRRLRIEVFDDGVGIDGPLGLGLTTTAERLASVGGGLRIHRRDVGGTAFIAWVPMGPEVEP